MAKPWKKYTKEMAKKFGYFATWEPGTSVRIGDVGILKKNLFTRTGGLTDLGIAFRTGEDETTAQFSHASSGKISMFFKAAGEPPFPGSVLNEDKAGVTIDFTKPNATVFEAAGCRSFSIEDQIALGKTILDRHAKGEWNEDWVVITELITAASATILISAASNAKIELIAATGEKRTIANLADASAGFTVAAVRGLHTGIVAGPDQNLTPLFKTLDIKSIQRLVGSRE